MKKTLIVAAATLAASTALVTVAQAQTARDQIRVVGSSTVFPYSTMIAEAYARNTGNAAPVVESTGTGGGMRIFCGGVGIDHADMTGASRAMTETEYANCVANGVTDITEILIGNDGISLAVSQQGEAFDISRADLFRALAAEVAVDGEIVANPYTNWSDIDPDLPNVAIQVLGPPPTSGTRDAWVELVMVEGCETFEAIAALEETDQDRFDAVCQTMREDGRFIEAGEDDNLIVQRLNADPTAYGIFGYSFYYENRDSLDAVSIDGVEPSLETIGDYSYPVARPLFLYVKNAHRAVIPGLEEFIEEIVSEDAIGDEGYLLDIGLVPVPEADREASRADATGGAMMTRYAE